jgi:hypothetical protein
VALDRVTAKRKGLINWLWYRNVPKGDDLNGLLTDRDGVLRDTSLAYKGLQERSGSLRPRDMRSGVKA